MRFKSVDILAGEGSKASTQSVRYFPIRILLPQLTAVTSYRRAHCSLIKAVLHGISLTVHQRKLSSLVLLEDRMLACLISTQKTKANMLCSGSGKTTVANAIREAIDVAWILVVPQDSFYKSLSRAQSKAAFENNYDCACITFDRRVPFS